MVNGNRNLLNRYLPKVQGKVNFKPKFTAGDFLKNNVADVLFGPRSCIIVFSHQLYKMIVDDLSLKESDLLYHCFYQEAISEDLGLYLVRICPGGPLTPATIEELVSIGG
jgi:hypothetical protein